MSWLKLLKRMFSVIGRQLRHIEINPVDLFFWRMVLLGKVGASPSVIHQSNLFDWNSDGHADAILDSGDTVTLQSVRGKINLTSGSGKLYAVFCGRSPEIVCYRSVPLFEHDALSYTGINLSTLLRNSGV
jgi:hypothetical protein